MSIRGDLRPLEDYEFLEYGNTMGTLGTLPHKQFDMVVIVPHQIILIN